MEFVENSMWEMKAEIDLGTNFPVGNAFHLKDTSPSKIEMKLKEEINKTNLLNNCRLVKLTKF